MVKQKNGGSRLELLFQKVYQNGELLK